MTFTPISLSSLKQVKNSVIGNPSAKLKLSQDLDFVQTLVNCLNDTPDGDDLRVEAAHVIASISYGSEAVLGTLLRCDAPRAFLYAISKLTASDSPALRGAFARGLRALAIVLGDTVGPSQWGLSEERSAGLTNAAEAALDAIFETESLDVILPLLGDPAARVYIAQLLGFAVRSAVYRTAVIEWMPLEERDRMRRTEAKSNRGWEKAPATANPNTHGGWICRQLTALVYSREAQLQEAALWALATIAKENASVVGTLNRAIDTGAPFLDSVLSFARSRSTNIQLAACSCATSIIRSTYPPTSPSSSFTSDPPLAHAPANTVMNVVNRILSAPALAETLVSRTRACFILFNLVSDHPALCTAAYERGCLGKLAGLLSSLEPSSSSSSSSSLSPLSEWQEEEPVPVAALREAALTALAALALFDNTIRRSITDEYGALILPIINAGLGHRSVGVRYASCQCVRALSRAVAVLRTNLVDSGLGRAVFRVFLKEERKKRGGDLGLGVEGGQGTSENREADEDQGEDRRVTAAALAAVCNIVNEFSPLRPAYLSDGLVPRLVKLVSGEDATLRLSSLWAMKNLLHKSSYETKRDIMQSFGWGRLVRLLEEPDTALQEQAWAVLRNLAEDETGVDMISRERELGGTLLLTHLTRVLKGNPSSSSATPASPSGPSDEDVVLQAACLLGNLANGASMQSLIVRDAELLASLRSVLAERGPGVRGPVVAAVLELAKGSTAGRRALVDAGVGVTLRRMCSVHATASSPQQQFATGSSGGSWGVRRESSAGSLGSGSTASASVSLGRGNHHGHMEDDRDVIDQAKTALDWLEHGEAYR
ncbi:ARM repeat-containing protein [Mycena amicta]|nr:ARM repeat-containing protein [Mycena amicta]